MQVMDYLGLSFFHEDTGRLMVCKTWFALVPAAVFDALRLSPKTLRYLLSLCDAESNLLVLKNRVETLEFEMREFDDDWSSLYNLQVRSRQSNTSGPAGSFRISERSPPVTWRIKLNEDLVRLADLAKECRKLHSVRIKAAIIIGDPSSGYLSMSTVRSFLSVDSLMALDLDLRGTSLSKPPGCHSSDDFHICNSIGVLLTTLTRLRLRMRDICTEVLKPKDHHGSKLRLSEVIINLSLSYVSRMATTKTHSASCNFAPHDKLQGRYSGGLKTAMETEAKALVPMMASPKVFRILSHELSACLSPLSFDVLTGKRMRLTEQMAWHEDGEEIAENSPDRVDPTSISFPPLPLMVPNSRIERYLKELKESMDNDHRVSG